MEKLSLPLKQGMVNCYRFGKGPKCLIALHGFARSGLQFQALTAAMGQHYTVYAPDLPFHGHTAWSAAYFDREDLRELVNAILAFHPAQPFYWMGYSLGGRLVLSQWADFRERLAGMVLLAPDGFGTGVAAIPELMPRILRQQFGKWLENPSWLLKLSGSLKKLGLLNRLMSQYLEKNLSSEVNRERLMHTWLSISHFRITENRVVYTTFPVVIVLGKQDPIVPPGVARSLKKILPEANLIWRDGGHQLLNQELGDLLMEVLD